MLNIVSEECTQHAYTFKKLSLQLPIYISSYLIHIWICRLPNNFYSLQVQFESLFLLYCQPLTSLTIFVIHLQHIETSFLSLFGEIHIAINQHCWDIIIKDLKLLLENDKIFYVKRMSNFAYLSNNQVVFVWYKYIYPPVFNICT